MYIYMCIYIYIYICGRSHQNLRKIHQNLRSWSQKSDQEFWFLKQKFPFVDTIFEHTSLGQARLSALQRGPRLSEACVTPLTRSFFARAKSAGNILGVQSAGKILGVHRKKSTLSILSSHLIQDSTSGVTQQDGGHVGHIYKVGGGVRETYYIIVYM